MRIKCATVWKSGETLADGLSHRFNQARRDAVRSGLDAVKGEDCRLEGLVKDDFSASLVTLMRKARHEGMHGRGASADRPSAGKKGNILSLWLFLERPGPVVDDIFWVASECPGEGVAEMEGHSPYWNTLPPSVDQLGTTC